MVGPLVYDLAQQHVSELLAERAMDRLATQVPRHVDSRGARIDVRRLFPSLNQKPRSAGARA